MFFIVGMKYETTVYDGKSLNENSFFFRPFFPFCAPLWNITSHFSKKLTVPYWPFIWLFHFHRYSSERWEVVFQGGAQKHKKHGRQSSKAPYSTVAIQSLLFSEVLLNRQIDRYETNEMKRKVKWSAVHQTYSST